ncbi:hypothetical protein PENTCL1PPCAC_24761, partial [Pristionchus entomophagus]
RKAKPKPELPSSDSILPTDILRIIISYADDAIGEMRLVCKLWHDLVEDVHYKTLDEPIADELVLTADNDRGIDIIVAELTFKHEFLYAFRSLCLLDFEWRTNDETFTATKNIHNVSSFRRPEEAFASVGSINRVVLRKMVDRTPYFFVVFRRVRINEIHVEELVLTSEYGRDVLKFIRERNIRCAHFEITDAEDGFNRENFLAKIAALVDVLRIKQCRVNERYLFYQCKDRSDPAQAVETRHQT